MNDLDTLIPLMERFIFEINLVNSNLPGFSGLNAIAKSRLIRWFPFNMTWKKFTGWDDFPKELFGQQICVLSDSFVSPEVPENDSWSFFGSVINEKVTHYFVPTPYLDLDIVKSAFYRLPDFIKNEFGIVIFDTHEYWENLIQPLINKWEDNFLGEEPKIGELCFIWRAGYDDIKISRHIPDNRTEPPYDFCWEDYEDYSPLYFHRLPPSPDSRKREISMA